MNPSEDMARLRNALIASDKQTQHFLQPLLPLRGVQDLLLTFVRDSSRSFEDWIWDPQVRQTLLRMRDIEPQDHAESKNLDQWYMKAAEERFEAITLQNPDDVTPPEFLEEADKAQSAGKLKFKAKNYYAAKNAFLASIAAVLKHQQSEYYGKSIPAAKWDDLDMQERYVTLCNNVAICGLKMKDLSLINEYAAKALTVDKTSQKALYAMAKLRILEHRYNEAEEIIDRALTTYPDKALFLNIRKEIKAVVRKLAKEQAELSELRAKQLAAAANAVELAMTQEEREEQRKKEMQRKIDAVPLPTREDDMFAAARVNVYLSRIKQKMMVDVHSCHNAELGEKSLFECTVVNGTTGEVLARNIQGGSKKVAKNNACKLVIEKLWRDKEKAGKLTPEDVSYLELYERAKAENIPLVNGPESPNVPQSTHDNKLQMPTRVSWMERQLQPLPLLNQLTQRGSLNAQFDIEDVSPCKEVTEFKCTGFLNGEEIATANAISKKKARAEVAKQVLSAAFEKKLLLVYDGAKDEDVNCTENYARKGNEDFDVVPA
ncbi:Tetratricopeptide repeat-containing domain [Plasmopara halstedii]|uniref:Tetratricopeptide repeat-containing domain n=1 Tax=Plasmopara halstedii TaxID=4781 RepID=A0A0P1AY37_PLAHL|nr:Tetratricopeptide repeat-containing domain [Plasmopara halstedii]CEG47352.1 Tetratricopeptide repeat-containing domain [Plasmopara halstedii]|eukprot:XP_024583721.1 Tetratricopeptide repeat-containing domain [Plasmopara halstedii]